MSLNKLLRWTAGLFAFLVLAAIWSWFFTWRSPPYYTAYQHVQFEVPIMTMPEYRLLSEAEKESHRVVEFNAGNGALLLYGSHHTKDPKDPQIADIETRWNRFSPSVALVEGRLGFLFPGLMDPVEHYGEMGTVNTLARSLGISVYTWEPTWELELGRMLELYSAERVALYYVLRPYFSTMQIEQPDDPDGFVEPFRSSRTSEPGLEGTLDSIEAIDAIWQRDFAEYADWRELSDANGYPGYLDEIFSKSNVIRDEHFANIIVDLVEQGEQVFAVAGSSHAVRMEATLAAAFATL